MQIKFWDKERQEYNEVKTFYIDEDMHCFTEEYGYESYLQIHHNIEPHFYLNNERIA